MANPDQDTQALNNWLKARKPIAARFMRRVSLLGAGVGVLTVAQAWIVANVTNGAVFADQSMAELMPWLWAMLPVIGLKFLANWGADRQAFLGALEIKRSVRAEMLDQLPRLGPVGLSNERSGELASSLLEGVEALEGYFGRYLPAVTMASMIPLILLIAIFPSDWVSGLVMIFTAPLIPVFMLLIGKIAEKLNQKQWRELTRMGGHFLDVLRGLTTLKLFDASRRELRNIERISEDFRRSTMGVLRVAFLSSAVLEFFSAISIAIVAVLIGFRLLDSEMAFLYGFFVLLLAPELYQPLRQMGVQNHARMEAVAAAENIVRLLDKPQRVQTDGAIKAIPPAADLRLSGIHFAYEPGRDALNGIDLVIPANQHTALVGTSGSGKSSLAALLLRMISPTKGGIRLGDRPLDNFDPASWQQAIAWIPQRAQLFSGTVADNIRLALPNASDAAIRDAAQSAHALEFIEALPNGFDTLIGEDGQTLSGGQAQRIAIARALLRDTPYLILDEPTAFLDERSQAQVQAALDALTRERTVLTIAHRLNTVRQADQIVVLDAGRIVEQGSFDALAQAGGAFQTLLQSGEALQ